MDRNCTACNIKIDKNDHKKDGTVFKRCHNKKKRKHTTVFQNQQRTSSGDENCVSHQHSKIEKNTNNENNGSLVIEFSNYGKTYLINFVLFQKQERERCASTEAA